jgi:septum formation protein
LFPKALILASTSRYRRALLERLGLPFQCVGPHVDESRREAESPRILASRLARAKAEAVARDHPQATVIGSDQVAARREELLGKPGSVEACRDQLRRSSGRSVLFLTAVHVIDGSTGTTQSHVDETRVHFRELSDDEIDRYIERDQPLDCAGGFKAESLGIALFERIESTDPTALTGLPLAWLCQALRRAGWRVP